MVVPAFSRGRPGPTRVVLPAGTGGVAHDSVLFCEELTTIDAAFLRDGPLGQPTPRYDLDEVIRAIRRALGELVPEPRRP